jgi:beta-lactamase regulating signal transducer with metallopeptidase domain
MTFLIFPSSVIASSIGFIHLPALSVAVYAMAQKAAVIAVSALWQGVLIAGVLALVFWLAPRTSAAHRFGVWAAAFVALVSLPVLSLVSSSAVSMGAGAGGSVSAAAADAWLNKPWLNLDARWSLLIGGLWAAATLWRAGDLVLHSIRLRVLWKRAIPVEVESSLIDLLAPATAAWHRRPVQVCTTATLQMACVIGFFAPRILIPDWLFLRLTAGELRQIVLHEAEHLRRKDDWTNLLQKVCLVLFPLNPALYWIEQRLCREREMACDDGVIRVTRAPRAYAACLASLAERGLQHRAEALSLGVWQRRPELVYRVHSILRGRHALGTFGSGALLGTLGFGLAFGSIALARCPQLVAFVPAQVQGSGDAAGGAAIGRPQVAAMRSGETSRAQILRANKTRLASAAGASGPRSVLPESEVAQRSEGDALTRNSDLEQATASRKTSSYEVSSRESHALNGIPAMPIEVHEEQWVLLAAWEQVETSSLNSGLTADYDTGVTAGDAAEKSTVANKQAGEIPANRITVTQLIFKIVPSSSVASTGVGSAHGKTTTTPANNGWFVLQL